MSVSSGLGGVVEFLSHTISEVTHRNELPIKSDSATELLTICSWCQKVSVSDIWIDIGEAINTLGLFELPLQPTLTHGICNDCHRLMIDKLAKL